jgi:hypothetical protein
MRLPRVRFTVRRMMVAVAVVAVATFAFRLLWLSEAYRRRAQEYSWSVFGAMEYSPHDAQGTARRERLINHYRSLAEKYAHAANRPWLPVEPDPTEPK